jgi:hypothetical protein
VTTPHPLGALWQPSYLHELDNLAQAAADSALAALASPTDADIAGVRFIHAYRRLHKQLTPFRQHNPDEPDTWPAAADRGLLFALLRLLSVLELLEPPTEIASWGRRRKKQTWCDGGDAALNLKELRPTGERLHQTADEVHQLVNTLLVRSVPESTRPHILANGQTAQQQLIFDSGSLMITLDGICHGPLHPIGFGIAKALSEAAALLSAIKLQASVRGCKGDEKTLRRHIAKLPPPIRNCIHGAPSSGRRRQLPPLE